MYKSIKFTIMNAMKKLITVFCIYIAASLLVYQSPQVQFYKKPRYERLYTLWKNDLKQLEKKPEFQKVLLNIGEVELDFTDPQVADELDALKVPFKKNEGASFKLKVGIIRWISGNQYGYILQHEIFDVSDDKIYEFGRTYKVGFIW